MPRPATHDRDPMHPALRRRHAGRSRGTTASAVALLLLLALGLTACGEDTSASDAETTPQAATTDEITFEDGWVKAADSGMSAAFGDLENGSDADLTAGQRLLPVASEVQLHETIPQENGEMAMQEKQDGFTVEAGSHHHFSPGADHLMLMGLTGPITAGDEVPFTLTFDDGTTLDISLVAKTFDGGDEDYHEHGDGASGDMGDMDQEMDQDMDMGSEESAGADGS